MGKLAKLLRGWKLVEIWDRFEIDFKHENSMRKIYVLLLQSSVTLLEKIEYAAENSLMECAKELKNKLMHTLVPLTL